MNFWDREWLIRTVWGEARGEGEAGMIAVCWVVLNRIKAGRWGKTAAVVCGAPAQFSCWGEHDPNHRWLLAMIPGDVSTAEAAAAVDKVLAGAAPDPTGGATFYYARSMAAPPAWAIGQIPSAEIGHQLFFKDIA